MREKLTVLNAFVHDVATGTWIASLVILALLRSHWAQREWAAHAGLASHLGGHVMLLTWVSLGVVLVTGALRMVTWKVFGWTGDVSRDRVRLLKIKHAVLGIAFLAGTAWMAAIAYG